MRGITSSRLPSRSARPSGQSDFLEGLADRGVDEIGVDRLPAAARQGHVAGPGIAGALGAADEEHRIGRGDQHHGDGRPDQRSSSPPVDGPVPGQPLAQPGEAGAQWLCE